MKHAYTLTMIVTGIGLTTSQFAHADLAELEEQFQSTLEQRSARTHQAVYDQLLAQGCTENAIEIGPIEEIPIEESDKVGFIKTAIGGPVPFAKAAAPIFSCTGSTLAVWENVKKLVHTGNEITGTGPTDSSLGLDLEGLGLALRWTAGEEYSTQESMTTSFNSAQQSNLNARIATLRASTPPTIAANATTNYASGLNAGDATPDAWSPWGGFLNGSYNTGDQQISDRENGFDFDGSEINAGVDYRLSNRWILGGLLSYREQNIDFDPSSGAVDGNVNMEGWSVLPFLLFQDEQWYSSISAGYQWNNFNTQRDVRFDSQNTGVEGADTQAKSSNNSNTVTANWAGGYSFQLSDALTLEPSIGANYQKVSIGEFSESNATQAGYNLVIEEQSIKSLESYFALKAQYVVNTQLGVFIPYLELKSVGQKETDIRTIKASYAEVQDFLTGDALFSLPTNTPDSNYKVYELGIAAVLKGASQNSFNGPASGGIQAFLNYRELADMGIYSQKSISGGIRYEF